MAGLNVDITANARQFQAEVDSVPTELKKIADQLDQVTKGGDKTGSSIESSMRKAQSATSQTEGVFRDLTSTVQRGTQEQTSAFELSNREVNKIQKETLKTTAASLAQTVEQSATAIDGTVSGTLSALQNITTGIAVFGGPELAVAAGAASLLVAGISGAFQKSEADVKAEAASVAALTAELEKLGKNGSASVSAINDKLKTFSTTTDGSDQDLSALRKTAENAGVSWVSYARAVAGSTSDQQKLYDTVKKQIPILEAQIKLQLADAQGRDRAPLERQLQGLIAVGNELEKQNSTLGLSKTRVQELAQAQTLGAQEAAAAQKTYSDTVSAEFSGIGATLSSAETQVTSKIASAQQALDSAIAASAGKRTKAVIKAEQDLTDAQSQLDQNSAQAFLDQQNAQIDTTKKVAAAKIAIYEKFGSDASQVIGDAGQNANLLISLAGADPATVSKILDNYKQLGTLAGQNLTKTAQDALNANPLQPVSAQVKLSIDTQAAERDLEAFLKSAGSRYSTKIAQLTRPGGPLQ